MMLRRSSSSGGQLDSGPEERLDGTSLVHGTVAFRHLVQGQGQVEYLAWIDFPVVDQVDQLGKEAAHWSRAAHEMDFGEEQLVAGQLHAVEDPNKADVPAGAGGADRLHHRLLRAYRLDHR